VFLMMILASGVLDLVNYYNCKQRTLMSLYHLRGARAVTAAAGSYATPCTLSRRPI
jgi:hypothetical protein